MTHYPDEKEVKKYEKIVEEIQSGKRNTNLWPVEAIRQCHRLAAGKEQYGED